MTRTAPELSERLKTAARGLGFDAAGIARADAPWSEGERLARFVELGRHGDMDWMATTAERRSHPRAMWPDARSALVVAMTYGPDHDPLDDLERRGEGVISVYARGGDYHDLIKKRLKRLAGVAADETGAEVKVFVDTAPLMEKPLAERAGVGWAGKHTNLVSRGLGSWFFLGVVLTAAELDPDAAETDHCGSCRACLDVCPTDAFPAARELDARRCVSYLTIEHKGPIPRALRAAMGNRIYGCDDCLAVCPWNKYAAAAREAALYPRPENVGPALADLLGLDADAFRAVFAGSPIKRIGRDRFLRNVLIAAGNAGDSRLVERVAALLDDPSPLVRGAAVWALWRLAPPERFRAEDAARSGPETDPEAAAEWAACRALVAPAPPPAEAPDEEGPSPD